MDGESGEAANPLSATIFTILFDAESLDCAAIPAAQARIWWAIDTLRKADDRSGQIPLLERLSQGLHLARLGTDPRTLHDHLAGLADEWLGCATLH